MSTIAKAEEVVHEIIAKLVTDKSGKKHSVPELPAFMRFGEFVHYRSDDGDVTIEFVENGSPFLDLNGNEKTEITSKEPPIMLSKRGVFRCHCFITPPGATARIGWLPDDPSSGGNHDVR